MESEFNLGIPILRRYVHAPPGNAVMIIAVSVYSSSAFVGDIVIYASLVMYTLLFGRKPRLCTVSVCSTSGFQCL